MAVAPPEPDARVAPGARAAMVAAVLPALQILLVGLAVLLLIFIARHAVPIDLSGLPALLTAPAGAGQGGRTSVSPAVVVIVGGLIFVVGLGLLGFLWWLASRFFGLIAGGKLSTDGLAGLKDLPFALPEGTIRAFLALIVAIIGLPILLFSKSLELDAAIGGYINGIITGVFAFYFGTRSNAGTMPAAAARTLVNAENRATEAETARGTAETEAKASRGEADQATRAARFEGTVEQLRRHLRLASAVVQTIGPALPAGVLPDGMLDRLRAAVGTAQQVLDGVKGVDGSTVDDTQLQRLATAAAGVIGSLGGNSSFLGALLTRAAPMLGGLGLPALAGPAGLIALLSVGARLGSAEFQRWRARVLAAPVAGGLIEFGTVTPQDAEAALTRAARFATALRPLGARPDLGAVLADLVLRDDGLQRIWEIWGAAGTEARLFPTQQDLELALTEYRQVLLAARAANDLPAAVVQEVTATLSSPARPASALLPDGAVAGLDVVAVERLVAAASQASLARGADDAAPQEDQAAFDALVTLVGVARRDGVDLARTLREVA